MQKTYNGATITFKRGTVKSRLRGMTLYGKLGVSSDTPNEDMLGYSYFVRLLTQCEVEGELGFNLPSANADPAELCKAYDAFMNADEALFDAVMDGLNAADEDFQPEALQPGKKN
jgi:hypothetical protein